MINVVFEGKIKHGEKEPLERERKTRRNGTADACC